MKFVIDMNLSPKWVSYFVEAGYHAVHWENIGRIDDEDSTIMQWARLNGHIVFTHDLDFGSMLAATNARSPSVIQIRVQDVSPESLSPLLFEIIEKYRQQLIHGSLVIVDKRKQRVRLLPLFEAD